jgi:SBDS protein C-terminal domain
MIQKALDEISFSVCAEKSAKSQALDGIQELQEAKVIPIQHARMRLRVTALGKEGKRVMEKLADEGLLGEIQEENFGEEYELILLIDPGKYRGFRTLLGPRRGGGGLLRCWISRRLRRGRIFSEWLVIHSMITTMCSYCAATFSFAVFGEGSSGWEGD